MKTPEVFPPHTQFIIRNQTGGMIWQVYTVENEVEVSILDKNRKLNGFESGMVEPNSYMEETWPGWRDLPVWQDQYKTALENLS